MPTDDEFRRVAEDVRALARSLARDIRGAVDRARDEPPLGERRNVGGEPNPGEPDDLPPGRGDGTIAAAVRATKDELRRAQWAVQQTARRPRHSRRGPGPWWSGPSGPGAPPHWGRRGPCRPSSGTDQAESADGADGADRIATSTMPRPPPGPWRRPPYGRPDRSERGRHGPAPAPAPPLRHRHDGSTLIGLLAVVFGLAWLAAGTNAVELPAEGVLAVALMVLGGTMVVTARTDWALSRKSWPFLGGVLLLVAIVVSSASPSIPGGAGNLEVGDKTVTITSWADLPAVIHGGIGRTRIDLTALDVIKQPRTLNVDDVAGTVYIDVPLDQPMVVDIAVAAGSITVNGVRRAAGLQRRYAHAFPPGQPAALTLDVNAGFGEVVITQPPRNPAPGAGP